MKKVTVLRMRESDTLKSFLEFGSLDETTGKREPRDLVTGQRAYDYYMLARYMNDFLAYRSLIDLFPEADEYELQKIYDSEVHHANDASAHLNKLCALSTMNKPAIKNNRALRFFEFGSTLFGCIEGIEYCQRVLEQYGNPIGSPSTSEIEWYGVDNCETFNRVATTLHSTHQIQAHTQHINTIPDCDVFFAKGVSLLYDIRSVSNFFDIVNTAPLSVFDYSFSIGETQELSISTGKAIVYLGISEFLAALTKVKKKFLVRAKTARVDIGRNRLFLDAVFGDSRFVDDFVALDTEARNAIFDRCPKNSFVTSFLAGEYGAADSWILFEEFCESNDLS